MRYLLISISLFTLVYITTSCKQVEKPGYLEYDWFAVYSIDQDNYQIVKNGMHDEFPPYLTTSSSFNTQINPDNSIDTTRISIEAGITDFANENGLTPSFTIALRINDPQLYGLTDHNKEKRLLGLQNLLSGTTFQNSPKFPASAFNLDISINDGTGETYYNYEWLGSVTVIGHYEIHFSHVEIIDHPELGKVLKIKCTITADLKNTDHPTGSYKLTANIRTYLKP